MYTRGMVAVAVGAKQLVKDGATVGRAVSTIRFRIITGDLSPGEPLRQEDMAQQLNMSRAPVREALQILADQGLVQHRTHSGYFVAKRPPSELAQIFLMLEFLETEIAKTISWPNDETLAELRSINERMRELIDSYEIGAVVELNHQFHFTIFGLSPLGLVLHELERLWDMAAPYIANKLTTAEARARTIDEHDRIIRALQGRRRATILDEVESHRTQRSELILAALPKTLRSRA